MTETELKGARAFQASGGGRGGQVGWARRVGHVGRVVAFSAFFVFSVLPGLRAQARRPMSLVDVAELPRLIGPQLSPDGKTLVYFVTTADWKANRLVYHLWRQSIGGGAPQQLTFTDAGDIPIARWSPDGTTILFMREGQIWLMSAGGGEPRALSKHATTVSPAPNQTPTWSPDGSTIFFLASDPRTPEERERDRVRDDVFAFDETYKQRQLWKIVVSTGAESQITSGDSSLLEYRLSADGKRIVFIRAPSPSDSDSHRGEVWVMDASGENARALTSNAIYEREVDISPDNSQVSFIADTNEKFEPYYGTNAFVVPASGGTPRPVLTDFRYTFDSATWAPDSRSIIATVNMGVHSEFFSIDVAARRARQITDGPHYIPPGWAVARSTGTLVFQLDEPTRFGEVWTLPIASGSSTPPTRMTKLYERVERDVALPRQERVEWKGADGTAIEGVLFYPVGYEQGKRYPLVVQMHGGPMESDKFGAGPGFLLSYVPVLAAKGYAVLRPNYRGSAGYGNAFVRDVNNGYFHNMATDILTGVDHLVQTGVADPDKLVIMGWSAGGTLVNKLITMTDRFKAASAGVGVANWTSLWGQTDNTQFRRTWFPGTPWQKNAQVEMFWTSSPLKDVSNVKTPTLFFSGDADIRVPLAQSIEMYRALKSLNVPTRLYVAPREGHTWGDLRHQIAKANAELEWFDKYALGKPYAYEKPPQP
jgi:dipeptidyl aminopeptidase/acylaminoacyl peptidase